MKIVLLFSLFIGTVVCKDPIPLDTILDMVVKDTDVNPTDGIISVEEFQTELIARWAGDANATSVDRHTFVTQWIATYHDSHDTTNAFFSNMDVWPLLHHDHVLTELDILIHMPTLDANGDQAVSVEEFRAFMHTVHPEGHGHNGK